MPIPSRTLSALHALAGLALAAAMQQAGAAPAPAKPAGPIGVYHIKPGFYVAADADCKAPANAAILQYDGRGLSGAHTRSCRASVRSHRGRTYNVEQSCIDSGSGPAPRSKERQLITVHDGASFSQSVAGRETRYRFCPAISLPHELRKALQN